MTTELVSITSTDRLLLPGLLYTPPRPTQRAAVWLHGMGDTGIFYNPDRTNALAKALADQGIAFLAFNNRGAHNSKLLRKVDDPLASDEQKYQAGTWYERIIDCVPDINGAAFFLKQRKFTELYLIGHSTGANKICAYHARTTKNPFSKYVMAGAGDDCGLFYTNLGSRRFRLALSYARQAIAQKNPLKIMPHYTGMHPFSAQAASDILDPDGAYNTFPFLEVTSERLGQKPLFEEYSNIDRPVQVIFGEADEYAYTAGSATQALDILRDYTKEAILPESEFSVVPGANHGFHGYEHEFAHEIAAWLGRTT